MWALGNIAGISTRARDSILECGIVNKILKILSQPIMNGTMLSYTYWTISSLCKGKPDPPIKFVIL
jgi:hypothetical protein